MPSGLAQIGQSRNETHFRIMALDQPRAQPRIFLNGERSRLLELVELLDLIGNTEPDNTSKFVAGLLTLLDRAVRHASSLEDEVGEHADVGSHNPDAELSRQGS